MFLNNLRIKNFRCFTELNITLKSNFTVLLGDNMAGKTTVLEAIRILISGVLPAFEQEEHIITYDDIRRIMLNGNLELANTPVNLYGFLSYYTKSSGVGMIRDNFTKGDTQDKIATFVGTDIVCSEFKEVVAAMRSGKVVNLPLLAYFELARGTTKTVDIPVHIAEPRRSRLEAYDFCFDTNNKENLVRIDTWYKTKEFLDKDGFEVAVIQAALKNCLDSCEMVYFDIEDGEFVMTLTDGRSLPFNLLSSGVRSVLHIVRDIAYRCVRLNPHLKEKATSETQGIVLIDELDAHLHPSWQQTIVEKLKSTFPKIQFIVTAHSPQIVASADANELIILHGANDDAVSVEPLPQSYKGWQLDYILRDIMESPILQEKMVNPVLKALNTAYENNDLENYDKHLVELEALLNPNDAILSIYRLRKTDLII